MRKSTLAAAFVLALSGLPSARAGEEPKPIESRLTVGAVPRVFRPSYALRQEPTFPFDKGEGTLTLGELGSFKVWARDRQILVDKNKDGKIGGDAVVAQAFPRPTSAVALHVGTADTREVFYHVSFTGYDAKAKAMRYTAAGALRGLVGGQQIVFLDENGNGSYTDAGTDALYLQGWPMAAPQGKLVLAGRRFHSIESVDGKTLRLQVKPVEVKAGFARVDAPTGIWVVGAVVEGGGNYFVLGRRATWLPEGDYRVVYALLANNAWTCTMLPPGNGMNLKVTEGKESTLPIRGVDRLNFEISVSQDGRSVDVKPPSLPLRGRAGETYTHWTTELPPPRVLFFKQGTGNTTGWTVFRRARMTREGSGRFGAYTWEVTRDNLNDGPVQIQVEWPTALAGTARGSVVVNVRRGKVRR